VRVIMCSIHNNDVTIWTITVEFQGMDHIISRLDKKHIVIANEWNPDRIESLRLCDAGPGRLEIKYTEQDPSNSTKSKEEG